MNFPKDGLDSHVPAVQVERFPLFARPEVVHPIFLAAQQYTGRLEWPESSTEYERLLVSGNVMRFATETVNAVTGIEIKVVTLAVPSPVIVNVPREMIDQAAIYSEIDWNAVIQRAVDIDTATKENGNG